MLHDIGTKKGTPTILRDLPGVRPDYVKRLKTLVSRSENFFKHADRDANEVLDFSPEATEIFLLDAVVTYEALTQEVVPILSTFKAWMFLKQPHLMSERDKEKVVDAIRQKGVNLDGVSKAEFFPVYMQAILQLGIA